MNEMVERVARALYEARWGGGDWDTLAKQRNAEFEIAKWMPMALAAIAAMREPTAKMAEAGEDTLTSWDQDDGNRCECDAKKVWPAMIDAALRD
jgi:hypothetical protein